MDILLNYDPTSPTYRDALFSNGPLVSTYTTQTSGQRTRQRLFIRLSTWVNEWFLDTSYGVDYKSFLGKKVQKSLVDNLIQQQILLEQGVSRILSFSSVRTGRAYECVFNVALVDGSATGNVTVSVGG